MIVLLSCSFIVLYTSKLPQMFHLKFLIRILFDKHYDNN